jgi:hypothetical protein
MEVAASAKDLVKLATAAKSLLIAEKKKGAFRVSETKNAQERELRNQIQKCISDMIR